MWALHNETIPKTKPKTKANNKNNTPKPNQPTLKKQNI